MKARRQRLYWLIGTILVGTAGFFWLRSTSTLFNLLIPPSGFYEPLASVPVDAAEPGYTLQVSHPYPGSYAVELLTARHLPNPLNEVGFEARVTISGPDNGADAARLESESSPFWGADGSGLILARYRVPDDVARSAPVAVSVNFEGDLSSFESSYGALSLEVAKLSDE